MERPTLVGLPCLLSFFEKSEKRRTYGLARERPLPLPAGATSFSKKSRVFLGFPKSARINPRFWFRKKRETRARLWYNRIENSEKGVNP